jgi:hypothetical protein
MALQTSGAISLNDIHQEAGGSANSQCSINDTDIRDLEEASGRTINNTTNTAIDFADFYGASAFSEPPIDPPGGGGGGGGGCILAGELILMEDGTFTKVEDIVIGDRVKGITLSGLSLEEDSWKNWSTNYNDFESTNTVSEVKAIQAEVFHTAFRLNFNNSSLKITGEHPTLVKRQNGSVLFVRVRDLVVGDEVRYFSSNSWEQITSIDLLENNTIMSYNLDAEAVDNYIAGGIVVHNAPGFK